MSTSVNQPTFSIVMPTLDQAQQLDENLPALLTQQYDAGFEVIVVDEGSTDESADVLKRLKAESPRLYTTFLPKYQFQKYRRRLAFTIGVKAAKNQWVILTDVTMTPPSGQWLSELQEFACKPAILLLGYINKKTGDVRLKSYDNIDSARGVIRKAELWRAGVGRDRWMQPLRQSTHYDFIVVRADYGHELLRLFTLNPWLSVRKER